MGRLSIFKEFLSFIKVSKNWVLVPIVIVLIGVGALLALSHGSALAPVIYAIF